MIATLLFVYGLVGLTLLSYFLIDRDVTGEVCYELKVPHRTTLVPIVIAVTWPLLLVIFLAGLLWYGFLAPRPVQEWE